MKISKLFHWLYAFLMFLPIMVLVPTLLYFGINKYVQPQTTVEEVYDYKEVDFNQQLKFTENRTENGITWTLDNGTFDISGSLSGSNNFSRYWILNLDILNGGLEYGHQYVFYTNSNVQLVLYGNLTTYYFNNNTLKTFTDDSINVSYASQLVLRDIQTSVDLQDVHFDLFDLTQMFGLGNEPTLQEFNSYYSNVYYPYTNSRIEILTIDTGNTETFININNEVQYSINSMWDFRIFSWAKTSFLVSPITYITGLFGMASTNVVNYYLSYWLAISIVYLVFDLVMYVPLLVHRWIDKGMLE